MRVEFTLNRYPVRNQQAAVRKFGNGPGKRIRPATLFPTFDNFFSTDRRRFRWVKPFPVALAMVRGLNESQTAALRRVLEGAGLCHPMLIFGPAGTGKTRTLVELTRVLLSVSTGTGSFNFHLLPHV